MFMPGVAPILVQPSGGTLNYPKSMRIFLGVHKHAPNLAVSGDTRWGIYAPITGKWLILRDLITTRHNQY